MTRALWFFALLAAFLVAGARCLSVFQGSPECERPVGVAFSQGSHAPAQPDPSTGGSIEDDSDDGVDALLATSPASFTVSVVSSSESGRVGALEQRWAQQSHTQSLERPPRA